MFLLTLDRAIQSFLQNQKLQGIECPDQAQGELQGYLEIRAQAMLQDLKENTPPRIIVMASLVLPNRGRAGNQGCYLPHQTREEMTSREKMTDKKFAKIYS
jgi:hypothetical protein